jgi:hypothetical protein
MNDPSTQIYVKRYPATTNKKMSPNYTSLVNSVYRTRKLSQMQIHSLWSAFYYIVISEDIVANPGPTTIYSWGYCEHPVTEEQQGAICCDNWHLVSICLSRRELKKPSFCNFHMHYGCAANVTTKPLIASPITHMNYQTRVLYYTIKDRVYQLIHRLHPITRFCVQPTIVQ